MKIQKYKFRERKANQQWQQYQQYQQFQMVIDCIDHWHRLNNTNKSHYIIVMNMRNYIINYEHHHNPNKW